MEEKRERNYGIDLLRLVSMFMVVMLHVLGRGGILNNLTPMTLKGETLYGLEIACYGAVNVFVLISGYVGLQAKHKYSNIIYLCLQVMFFAITITSVEIALTLFKGGELNAKALFWHLFPSMQGYWYFSAYFILFFFMPVLNIIVNNTPRNTLKVLAIFIFLIFCCWNLIMEGRAYLSGGYSFLWLAIMYTTGAYIAKYKPLSNVSCKKSLLGYLGCVFITMISRPCIYYATSFVFGTPKLYMVLMSYISPTIVIGSIFLLNAFSKMEFKGRMVKFISALSPLAFGVYLVHCHPYIGAWRTDLFTFVAFQPLLIAILSSVGIALLIYTVSMAIDGIRLWIFNRCKIRKFCIWIEAQIKKTGVKFLKIFHITFDESEKTEK